MGDEVQIGGERSQHYSLELVQEGGHSGDLGLWLNLVAERGGVGGSRGADTEGGAPGRSGDAQRAHTAGTSNRRY